MGSKSFYLGCAGALLVNVVGIAPVQAAADATTIGAPVVFNPLACAIYGDFYSCSTQLLEQVANPQLNNVYALPVGPGQLQKNIVIGDNPGNGATNDLVNSDLFGSTVGGTGIDDGYQTPTGAQCTPCAFSTKDAALGGAADPTAPYPFAPEFAGDMQNYWDISVSNLQTFLAGGNLVVGFDHNQTGSGSAQNLLAWALVVFTGAGQPDRVFELTNSALQDPFAFTSGKSIASDPTQPLAANPFGTPNDFVVSNGQLCTAGPFTSKSDCVNAGGLWADSNKGNGIDFLVWAPEIDAFLHSADAANYSAMHVRWDMEQLDNGAETAFIMAVPAGPPPPGVPEPETLLLTGIGFLGLYATRRRQVAGQR